MKKAVLITSHFWSSKRRAGFHNIAESLIKKGYEVLFLTGNASYIHHLKSDYRAELIKESKLNTLEKISDRLSQFIRFTKLHPVNYRSGILNYIFLPSVKNYSNVLSGYDELNEFIKTSDIFIFESFPGLLWFEYIKKINANAKFIYRVSDDLRQLKKHPFVIEHERKILSKFDLISVPSGYFLKLFDNQSNVKLHYHGINKEVFDIEQTNPYPENKFFNFVFTGNAYLDHNFLKLSASVISDERFHVIGSFKKKVTDSRILYYGELDFSKTIPYVKFANAGLHILEYTKGAESFSDSLKVMQYTYCRLPVIAPEFIKSSRNNFIFYKPGDESSIAQALRKSKEFDRSTINIDNILSWDEVTEKIINE